MPSLMKLSETCGLGPLSESPLCDRLILGVRDDRVRENLPGKRDLDLDKVIEVITVSQVTHSRASQISEEFPAFEEINAVKHKLNVIQRASAGNPRLASLSLPTRVPQSVKGVFFLWWYTCN